MTDTPMDLDTITHQCVCGSVLWKVLVTFDDFEIATYSLDMYCAECGAKAIAPTPLDRPEERL
jgi:hypothetical protein